MGTKTSSSTSNPALSSRRVDATRHRNPILDETNGDTPLGDAHDELAGAVDGVDDPDSRHAQAGRIVDGLLREPPLTINRQYLGEGLITSCARQTISLSSMPSTPG